MIADIKKIDVERNSLRSLGSGRRMLIMTMKKCVHVHLREGSRGRVEGLAPPPPAAFKYNWYSSPPPKKKTWWFIDAEVKHEMRLENLR